jgi:hypothetical protein
MWKNEDQRGINNVEDYLVHPLLAHRDCGCTLFDCNLVELATLDPETS